MAIPTYRPGFRIMVYKTRQRADTGQPSRLQGPQEHDITPLLGDNTEIRVTKGLYAAMGSFVIRVADKPYAPGYHVAVGRALDTLYGLLEPMDEVEIRLARNPEEYQRVPPILMRGFIRQIRRDETMSAGGKPVRQVVIIGHDYGLVFETAQIPPMPWLIYGLGTGILAAFEPYLSHGIDKQPFKVGEFLQLMLDLIINDQLKLMKARYRIELDDPLPTLGRVWPPGADQLTGPIWSTMRQYSDDPWNELWLEDPPWPNDEQHPRLRLRPAPWRTWIKNGKVLNQYEWIRIMDQESTTETLDIGIEDVVQLDASRSDYDVANLMWVDVPGVGTFQASPAQMAAAANSGGLGGLAYFVLDGDTYPNSDQDLYGHRVMQHASTMLPDAIQRGPTDLPEDQYNQMLANLFPWITLRRKALAEMNCDNVVLEEGAMTIKGNEKIRVGRYLRLKRGLFTAEYYVKRVSHVFAPYRHYLTTVDFVRGTGFIERVRSARPPYLLESKQGPYS